MLMLLYLLGRTEFCSSQMNNRTFFIAPLKIGYTLPSHLASKIELWKNIKLSWIEGGAKSNRKIVVKIGEANSLVPHKVPYLNIVSFRQQYFGPETWTVLSPMTSLLAKWHSLVSMLNWNPLHSSSVMQIFWQASGLATLACIPLVVRWWAESNQASR